MLRCGAVCLRCNFFKSRYYDGLFCPEFLKNVGAYLNIEELLMSDPVITVARGKKHRPFVPENMQMKEFTLRAVLLGLGMTVLLGAANAYLGLRAGQTIAATYPAAVIGMAVLRLLGRGTILEKN